jgi:enamine deaminase RidA (YjgF/YER057c/UK114 family)
MRMSVWTSGRTSGWTDIRYVRTDVRLDVRTDVWMDVFKDDRMGGHPVRPYGTSVRTSGWTSVRTSVRTSIRTSVRTYRMSVRKDVSTDVRDVRTDVRIDPKRPRILVELEHAFQVPAFWLRSGCVLEHQQPGGETRKVAGRKVFWAFCARIQAPGYWRGLGGARGTNRHRSKEPSDIC